MKVIEEVVGASQNDFEENGVQQQTLSELQQVGPLLLLMINICTRQHLEDVLFEFLLHSFRFHFLENYGVRTCCHSCFDCHQTAAWESDAQMGGGSGA